MGIMSRLHWEIFSEPSPESDCCREEKYQEEERTTLFWEERKARSLELEEQQRILNQRCARVAQILKAGKAMSLIDAL
jgi:hypothetical protein